MTVPQLTPEEYRVLGCLAEKQLTTPQQYPLTLNALTLACNQSTNRDPVVAYPERLVEGAVTAVKERGLARFVHPSHGRSVLRFRHSLDEALALDVRGLALVCVLLLRGPQTPGELRTRTERMATFDDAEDLQRELERLESRPEPLVACLGRRPGQKEDRYTHLLAGSLEAAAPVGPEPPPSTPVAAVAPVAPGTGGAPSTPALAVAAPTPAPSVQHLAGEVERLRHDLDALRHDLDALRHDLGA